MRKTTRKLDGVEEDRAPRLGMMIHEAVREAVELAVEEELEAALGARRYARTEERRGHRNGSRTRTLTGPTGPVALPLPRATLFSGAGDVKE